MHIIITNRSPASESTFIAWITATLLLLYLAIAPVWSQINSHGAGLFALFALVFGWKGLKICDSQTRLVLFGFFLYVVSALPGLMNNVNWHDAGWRFESYHPFLLAIPMWGLFARSANRLPTVLLWGLIGAGLLLLGYTAYRSWYLNVPRIGGWSGLNSNIFGYIAGLVATSLFAAITSLKLPIYLRILMITALFGAISAVLASGSRGVLLATFISLVVTTYLLQVHNTIPRRYKLAAGSIVFLTIIGCVVAIQQSDYWEASLQRLTDELLTMGSLTDGRYTSTGARVFMGLGAWQIWMDNFWIGTGLGDSQDDLRNLKIVGPLIVAEHPELAKSMYYPIFHNIFADSFATTGLLGGLTMIITILWLPLRYFLNALRRCGENEFVRFAALAGIGIGCINIVFGFTNSWLYLNNLPYTISLLLILMVVTRNVQRPHAG